MDKWPQQYTVELAQRFLQQGLGEILERLDRAESELRRLEESKQDRKGRKPAGCSAGGNGD